MNVEIHTIEPSGDLVRVTGLVDGKEVRAVGWAARITNAKSEEAKVRYLEELLRTHTMLSPEHLPELPRAKDKSLDHPFESQIPMQVLPVTVPWAALYAVGSFILGACIEHFLRW